MSCLNAILFSFLHKCFLLSFYVACSVKRTEFLWYRKGKKFFNYASPYDWYRVHMNRKFKVKNEWKLGVHIKTFLGLNKSLWNMASNLIQDNEIIPYWKGIKRLIHIFLIMVVIYSCKNSGFKVHREITIRSIPINWEFMEMSSLTFYSGRIDERQDRYSMYRNT